MTLWLDYRRITLGWEDPLEKAVATHFSILAWRIPWIDCKAITFRLKVTKRLMGHFKFSRGHILKKERGNGCYILISPIDPQDYHVRV